MIRNCFTCLFQVTCRTQLSSRPDNLARSSFGSCRFYKAVKKLPYVRPFIHVQKRFF